MRTSTFSKGGFTLIELMIVVAIIGIIAAIAIPSLLSAKKSANEASAVSAMRTISTAQAGFWASSARDDNADGQSDYGTLAQLADTTLTGQPFIDPSLALGTKQGYIFVVVVTAGTAIIPATYDATALPAAPGRTGVRSFYVNDDGVVRFTSDGSTATSTSLPLS